MIEKAFYFLVTNELYTKTKQQQQSKNHDKKHPEGLQALKLKTPVKRLQNGDSHTPILTDWAHSYNVSK